MMCFDESRRDEGVVILIQHRGKWHWINPITGLVNQDPYDNSAMAIKAAQEEGDLCSVQRAKFLLAMDKIAS